MKRIYIELKKIYYWFLALFTRGRGMGVVINDLKLRMPAYYYRHFGSDYEKDNLSFFRRVSKPGMTCLDIGAHIGLYSVFMSKLTNARVFCFEPTPDSIKVLKETIAINKCNDRVTLIPAAVSEKSGRATFFINNAPTYISKTSTYEGNSLVEVDLGKDVVRKGYDVEVVSIDDFTEKNKLQIDFIKIDVEGVEVGVLRGAKNTIFKNRPSGILGLHPFAYKDSEQTLTEIWKITREYNLKLLFEGKEIAEAEFCRKKEIFDVQFLPAVY